MKDMKMRAPMPENRDGACLFSKQFIFDELPVPGDSLQSLHALHGEALVYSRNRALQLGFDASDDADWRYIQGNLGVAIDANQCIEVGLLIGNCCAGS
jgi:hypothetical protein